MSELQASVALQVRTETRERKRKNKVVLLTRLTGDIVKISLWSEYILGQQR